MVAAEWCACTVWELQVGMRHAHRVSLDATMTTTALKVPQENADGGTRRRGGGHDLLRGHIFCTVRV